MEGNRRTAVGCELDRKKIKIKLNRLSRLISKGERPGKRTLFWFRFRLHFRRSEKSSRVERKHKESKLIVCSNTSKSSCFKVWMNQPYIFFVLSQMTIAASSRSADLSFLSFFVFLSAKIDFCIRRKKRNREMAVITYRKPFRMATLIATRQLLVNVINYGNVPENPATKNARKWLNMWHKLYCGFGL